MKLLIAYDGSESAQAALDDLRRAGLPNEAQALVVSVAEVWLPPPGDESSDDQFQLPIPTAVKLARARAAEAVDPADTLAKRARDRVQGIFPNWAVRHRAVSGSPAWELLKCEEEWQPDLVIVGSQGRTAVGRFVLGSVSQKILTEARTSVRVARGQTPVGEPPQRIVIGVDGSPCSVRALQEVASRHWIAKSEAHVVVVQDPLNETVAEMYDELRKWAQVVAATAADKLRKTSLTVTEVIETGDPKQVLTDHAESWEADCIFVGAKGHGFIERFLLSSVSSAVAARSHCSVEVVRITDTASERHPNQENSSVPTTRQATR
jgi:nucleotide-binding universal stress UspA family protein